MAHKKQLAFVVDLDRCIGCRGCQVACHMENGTPLGTNRINVYQVGPFGSFPDLHMYFLPAMCQQCADPVCVRVCPTMAIHKNPEDGVVLLDTDQCIGCQSCNRACPYHVNTFSLTRKQMDKCTLCVQNREAGGGPACVRNCSGSALHWGDLNDPESEVSRLLAEAGEEHVFALRDFGNHPSARYILRHEEWRDLLPQELEAVAERRKGR